MAILEHSLQQRQNILHSADFLICNQNLSIIQNSFHLIGVRYHIGRNVATIKLHALNHLTGGLSGLGLLNGNHAVSGYLFHSLSNQFANHLVCSGNSCHTGDIIAAADCLALCLNTGHSRVHSGLNTILHYHGVSTGSHILHAFAYQRLGQQCSGGGTVTGIIVSLGRNFLYQLSAHVLKGLLQLNFFCNGYTVVGNQRCAVLFVQHHIAPLGTKGNFNSIGQLVNTRLQRLAGVLTVNNIFCHNGIPPYSTTAKMSLTSEMVYS